MLVPVTYTGPRDVLDLSWTTDGLHFERGATTLVPEPLVSLLKGLPGHGFSISNAAAASIPEAAVPVEDEPAPAPEPIEPAPEPDEEPAPAPAPKKPGRKAKEA